MASVFCLIATSAAPASAQTPAAPSTAPAAPSAAPATTAPATVAPATAAPAAPPPPPPGYGYPPPPGYAYPPPPYGSYPAPLRPPESVPYEGGPVPAGYHVEERPRRGLIIAGAVVLGIPWALSVTIASSSDFSNQSGWLIVPALGPWITMAARKKETLCDYSLNGGTSSYCHEEVDNGVRTVLILDGLTQAAGAIMLVYGLASPKKVIARDFMGSLHFTPAPMGKLGYGGVLTGEF